MGKTKIIYIKCHHIVSNHQAFSVANETHEKATVQMNPVYMNNAIL